MSLDALLNHPDNQLLYRYILIDMLGVTSELSPLYPESLNDKLPYGSLLTIKRPELLHDPASCPHLICIGEPGKPTNQSLLSASIWQVNDDFLVTKQYVCAWLTSELPIEELGISLEKTGKRLGDSLSMPFVPFYEPFKLQLLQDSHPSSFEWINNFLPQNTSYYYIDIEKKIRKLNAPEQIDLSFRFIEPQIRFFQQESRGLFKLYNSWYEINQKQGFDLKPGALKTMIHFYREAHSLGLTHQEDKIIFILFSMQYGDLMAHTQLENIILSVINEAPGTLAARFKEIDTQFSSLTK